MKRLNSTLHYTLFFTALFFSVLVYGQVQRPVYVSMTPDTRAHYEYLPEGYDQNGSEKYPLLLFVHGTGEYGYGTTADLPFVLRNGPPHLIDNGEFPKSFNVNGNTFKFIVISPQFIHWPSNADIKVMLDFLISKYKIDVSRIYFTGLSMGGGVVWNYAGASATGANRLAAIATACGASYPAEGRIDIIADANLPVWAFHNSGDPTVPSSWTNGYVDGLNEAGINPRAKKTIFQAGGHDCWSRAYDPSYTENGMNVYEWMLQYTNSRTSTPPPPPVNKLPVVNAGANISVNLLSNSVSFDNATASDPDGTIATYKWSKVSGPSQYSFSNTGVLNPTVSNLVTGIYVFRLTVTDNDGGSSYDNVTVTVVAPTDPDNNPPAETTKTINVNINDDINQYTNSAWNNWVLANGEAFNISYKNFAYSDGSTSGISATLSYSLKLKDNTSDYVEGMAPEQVLRYSSCSDDSRTLVISGLSSSKTYDIDLFASRSIKYNSTVFFVNKEVQDISTYNNATNDALFEDLSPDSDGNITIVLRSGTVYNYLNGFTLTENPAVAVSARKTIIAKQNVDINLLKTSPNLITPAFGIYPNPVKDKFMVQLNNNHTGNTNVRVVDISGKVRKNITFKKDYTLGNFEVYAKDLPAGTYIVQVQTGNFSEAKKIVKL